MNGTNDGHDASAATNERLDQLLSLRQDGALDAHETAELEALLSQTGAQTGAQSGAAGERARARARSFAEVDERLRRLAAQAIPPARLARGLEAIERRLAAGGAEGTELAEATTTPTRMPTRTPTPMQRPTRSTSRRRWLGLGLGLAAAAALAFALLALPRRDAEETPAPPSLATSDATIHEETATSDATTPEENATTSEPTAVAVADATTDAGTDALPVAKTDGVGATSDPRDERGDDDGSAGTAAEELASIGLDEPSDLEVIDELELLDFLASRDRAPEGPRG